MMLAGLILGAAKIASFLFALFVVIVVILSFLDGTGAGVEGDWEDFE